MREMKDSGVDWIGEIPKDWKCCKQKYEIQLLNGRAVKELQQLSWENSFFLLPLIMNLLLVEAQ